MSGARRLTDDAIRDALAVSARAKPRPDLDSAIARAIRTTRQDQPPLARRLGLSPGLSLPGLRVVRIGLLLALVLALVGMALLVGALLRRPVLPTNGAIDLVVNDQLIEVAPNGAAPRRILSADVAAGGPVWSRDGGDLAVWMHPAAVLSGQPVADPPFIAILTADGGLTATISTVQMALGGRAVAMGTGTISWSPDGASVVFDAASGGQSRLYRYDLATGRVSDITPPGGSGPVAGLVARWARDRVLLTPERPGRSLVGDAASRYQRAPGRGSTPVRDHGRLRNLAAPVVVRQRSGRLRRRERGHQHSSLRCRCCDRAADSARRRSPGGDGARLGTRSRPTRVHEPEWIRVRQDGPLSRGSSDRRDAPPRPERRSLGVGARRIEPPRRESELLGRQPGHDHTVHERAVQPEPRR